jgi:transcriptional regulator with XRE-family HTH domain
MSIDPKVGERVRLRREALGVSVHDLAISCGVGVELMQDYEAGTVRVPSARLRALTELLEVPLADLDPSADGASEA